MKHAQIRSITIAGLIAALYAVGTLALWQFSSLGIQCRLSEALCILPAAMGAAVPGVTVGCLIANLIGGNIWDVIFGTLATLVGAAGTYFLGRRRASRFLLPLPTVISNAAVLPFVLYYGYGLRDMAGLSHPAAVLGLYALSIAAGEAIVLYAVGLPLHAALRHFLPKD